MKGICSMGLGLRSGSAKEWIERVPSAPSRAMATAKGVSIMTPSGSAYPPTRIPRGKESGIDISLCPTGAVLRYLTPSRTIMSIRRNTHLLACRLHRTAHHDEEGNHAEAFQYRLADVVAKRRLTEFGV